MLSTSDHQCMHIYIIIDLACMPQTHNSIASYVATMPLLAVNRKPYYIQLIIIIIEPCKDLHAWLLMQSIDGLHIHYILHIIMLTILANQWVRYQRSSSLLVVQRRWLPTLLVPLLPVIISIPMRTKQVIIKKGQKSKTRRSFHCRHILIKLTMY